MTNKTSLIIVNNVKIAVKKINDDDYISLTDMAGYNDSLEARVVVSNWMSIYFTLDFLAIWEEFNNPDFNRMEYHTFRNSSNRLVMTPKRWVEKTNAIGIISVAITQLKSLFNDDRIQNLHLSEKKFKQKQLPTNSKEKNND